MKLPSPAILAALTGILLPWQDFTAAPREGSPNVIIIVTDDAGWADFGFNGCKDIPTPRIDSIAREGVNFTTGYVTGPVCSPSRAGLLAGRHQSLFGHEYNITGHESQGLPTSETLLPERLRRLGYATGAFGKWHLGGGHGHRPNDRGFETSYGFISGSRGYLGETHERAKDSPAAWRRNGQPVVEREYATDAIARECESFIDANRMKPFFIYAAFNCPHSPLQSKPGYEQGFTRIPDPKRRVIAAMLKSQDEAVGRILDAIQKHDLAANTIVWFINDNGAATYGKFDNGPWRGNKGTLFEGGIRVAFAARWPGKFPSELRYEHPVSSLDIAATSLAASGAPAQEDGGEDLLPHLRAEIPTSAHDALYWRYQPAAAIRRGDWKLLMMDGKPHGLWNLKEDPSEMSNHIGSEPGKVRELDEMFQAWNKRTVPPLWRGDSGGLNEGIRKLHRLP